MDLLGADTGATFSDCRTYRYRLWRTWDVSKPAVAFIMLNPSTADDVKNDPTIERCQRRAAMLGYGRLDVVNLFAFRSPSPKVMKKHPAPIGPENDAMLIEVANGANLVVCAWGGHGGHMGRATAVLAMLDRPLHCLRRLNDGSPEHPLYIPYDKQPEPYP